LKKHNKFAKIFLGDLIVDINIIKGKSNYLCLDKLFENLKNRDKTKKHIIIAPDRCLFSLEQKLFEKTGESCFFDVDIISLTRLSKQVLKKDKFQKILSKQSGVALVQKLLIENKDKLKAFAKSIEHIGFAETLFETICFYKSCNVLPQDMYVNNSSSLANLKQHDIKLIYSLYENYLQSEYTDSFNQLKLFAKSIDKKTFPNTIFYFVEFEDFTSIMYDIILKLSKCCENIYITCTYGKNNNNSNIYSNKVYLDLIDLYKVNGLNFNIIDCEDFADPIKKLIADNLFAFSITRQNSKPDIYVNAFNNINDEIKYTIADIYSLCLTKKIDFSKVALVLPSIMDYKNKLNAELKKYNIPFYFDESDLLINHILIRNLFAILNILNDDFSTADFSSLIKSKLFDFDYADVCSYDISLKKIGALPYECINTQLTENEKLLDFFELLNALKTECKECTVNLQFVEIAIKIFNNLIQNSARFYETCDPLSQRIYNQAIQKFENICKDFNGVFGNETNNLTDFIVTFKSYFESTNISMPPINSNTLFIADVNSSYIPNIDYIYILGCNEGVLPKFSLDNGLVTDDEIAKLPNAKKLSPTIKMINERKLFKLFEICLKYGERLTLSYKLSSNEGAMYPNTLITSILKLFDIEENHASSVLDVVEKSITALDYDLVSFNNLNDKIALDNLLDYLKNWDIYNDKINYRKLLSTLYASNQYKLSQFLIQNYNKPIKIADVQNVNYFNNNKTSVSQIENFFNCPYKHFVRYGLKLNPSINSQIKPNDIGTIIHEVLKDILPFIIQNTDKETEILTLAKSYLNKVLNSEAHKFIANNVDNKYIIKSLYNELERICKNLINYVTYSNFKPKYYEYRFNSGDFKVSNIAITGAIDRVDVHNNEFIIFDYKTGSTNFNDYTDVLSGKKLQLLVYSKIFAGKSKLKPVGAFYMPLSNSFSSDNSNLYTLSGVMIKDDAIIKNLDTRLIENNASSDIVALKTTKDGAMNNQSGFYKNMCIETSDYDDLLDFAIQQVQVAIDSITQGEIAPKPLADGKWSACKYCDYKAICCYLGDNNHNVVKVETIKDLIKTGEEDGGIQAE